MLVDNIFVPTWLYIKQHNDTGLKYFGKTVRKDPIRYKGSGTYWNRHLEKHGDNVTTLWCQLFTDKNQLTEYALNFSKDNNIVESTNWANLEYEDGLSGSGLRRICTPETIAKRSKALKGKKRTSEQKIRMSLAQKNRPKKNFTVEEKENIALKISLAHKGKTLSNEHKQKLSDTFKGKSNGKRSEETKQKMRKPKSEDHKANMRKPKSPEHIAAILAAKALKKQLKNQD